MNSQLRTYNDALQLLDAKSWALPRCKAHRAFSQDHLDRGKQAFFNQLNEAFAYRLLSKKGYQSIAFLSESKKLKSPDLKFFRSNNEEFCEVKTISISQDAIARFKTNASFNNSIHHTLTENFLSKLRTTISTAIRQVQARGRYGLVYLVIHFDDFTLEHYSVYRQQVIRLIRTHFPTQEVFIKIGIQGRRHIHNKPLL